MDKYIIKLIISDSKVNIDKWFQYYISLGVTRFVINMDHDSLNFYRNFGDIKVGDIDEYDYSLQINELIDLKTGLECDNIDGVFFNFYKRYGFLIVRNLFDRNRVEDILGQAKYIYKTQMLRLKLITDMNVDDNEFEDKIKILFRDHFDVFLNCGKQCQHIIDLWKLSLDDSIIDIIKTLGIKRPHISTRPVLFSNSRHISKSEINHTVPPHQDWASMQGSINSIICWTPLIDVNQDLGAIGLVPSSHTKGLLTTRRVGSFGLVDGFSDFNSIDFKQGDCIFFSSFLVHKSGNNITDNIRWSTHFRYNDLNDVSFIRNGYPHAYIYKPVDEIIVSFDVEKDCDEFFNN